MAERVVDRLEVVEIDAEDGDVLAAGEAGFGRRHLLEELHTVGQLGQRVVAGEVADALLVLALLGDVFVRGDPAAILHRMVLHHDGAAV
jgi:hypothetical protein